MQILKHIIIKSGGNMKKIYEASGTLNKGFVGQIAYSICLDKEYQNMDIQFSFDKQRHQIITEELKEELKEELVQACGNEYANVIDTEEKIINAIHEMKTEIHTIAMMNDTFIGGIHKQLTTRNMIYSKEKTSEGCIPQENISGVIKIILVVFNVIQDNTNYSISLSAN